MLSGRPQARNWACGERLSIGYFTQPYISVIITSVRMILQLCSVKNRLFSCI